MEKEKWARSAGLEPHSKADKVEIRRFGKAKGTQNTVQKKKWMTPTVTGPFAIGLQLVGQEESISLSEATGMKR